MKTYELEKKKTSLDPTSQLNIKDGFPCGRDAKKTNEDPDLSYMRIRVALYP